MKSTDMPPAMAGSLQQEEQLRTRSGRVVFPGDRLTSFLYDLLRDDVSPGRLERLVRDAAPDCSYTNGYLANYARDAADRLRDTPQAELVDEDIGKASPLPEGGSANDWCVDPGRITGEFESKVSQGSGLADVDSKQVKGSAKYVVVFCADKHLPSFLTRAVNGCFTTTYSVEAAVVFDGALKAEEARAAYMTGSGPSSWKTAHVVSLSETEQLQWPGSFPSASFQAAASQVPGPADAGADSKKAPSDRYVVVVSLAGYADCYLLAHPDGHYSLAAIRDGATVFVTKEVAEWHMKKYDATNTYVHPGCHRRSARLQLFSDPVKAPAKRKWVVVDTAGARPTFLKRVDVKGWRFDTVNDPEKATMFDNDAEATNCRAQYLSNNPSSVLKLLVEDAALFSPGHVEVPVSQRDVFDVEVLLGVTMPGSLAARNARGETPEQRRALADEVAKKLGGLPETQKTSELRVLHQADPLLSALVFARLRDLAGSKKDPENYAKVPDVNPACPVRSSVSWVVAFTQPGTNDTYVRLMDGTGHVEVKRTFELCEAARWPTRESAEAFLAAYSRDTNTGTWKGRVAKLVQTFTLEG